MTEDINIEVRPRFTFKPEVKIGEIVARKEVLRLEIVKDYHTKEEILHVLKTGLNEPEKIKVNFNIPEDKKILVKAGIEVLENGKRKE